MKLFLIAFSLLFVQFISSSEFKKLDERKTENCIKDFERVKNEGRICPNSCSKFKPCMNIHARCVCDEPCGFVCLRPGTKCPDLRKPQNAFVDVLGDRKFETFALYECRVGFQLVGNEVRKCQSDGLWSGKEPFCIEDDILCAQPDFIVPNSKFEPVEAEYEIGTEVIYKCDQNISFPSTATTKCEYEDGKAFWTSITLRCIDPQCGPPEKPQNGRIVKQTGHKLNDVVHYECNEHSTTTDETISICKLEGKEANWSENPPNCLGSCNITHLSSEVALYFLRMNVVNPETTPFISHGDVLQIICRHYKHEVFVDNKFSSSVRCNNGTLSGSKIDCKLSLKCDKLLAPINGSVVTDVVVSTTGLIATSVATYECIEGFQLNGTQNRSCGSDGKWTGTDPSCVKEDILCLMPEFVSSNVDIDISLSAGKKYFFLGEKISYNCKKGFRNNFGDSITAKCQLISGKAVWVSSVTMNCQIATCFSPEHIPNGFFTGKNFSIGEEISYECIDGYKIKGFASRICLNHGRWSGSPPICEAVICDDPQSTIANGRVTFEKPLKYKSLVKYECHNGFSVVGDKERRCNKDGQLTGIQPECKQIDCGEPVKPQNGHVLNQTGTKWNDSVQYECDAHATLFGEVVVVCGEDSKWSRQPPKCLRNCVITYKPFAYFEHKTQKLKIGDYIEHGETVNFVCDNSHEVYSLKQNENFVERRKNLTCDDGVLSKMLILCLPAKCLKKDFNDRFLRDRHLKISGAGIGVNAEHKDFFPLECHPEYSEESEQLSNVTCVHGQWLYPMDPKIRCQKHKITATTTQKTTLKMTPSTLKSSRTTTSRSILFPSANRRSRPCIARNYLNLEVFQKGEQIEQNPKFFGSETSLSFRCPDSLHFKFTGASKITCSNGRWSDEWPKCIAINSTNEWYSPPPVNAFNIDNYKRMEDGEFVFPKNSFIYLSCNFHNIRPLMLLNDVDVETMKEINIKYAVKIGFYFSLRHGDQTEKIIFQCIVPHNPPNEEYSNSIAFRFSSTCDLNEQKVILLWGARIHPSSIRYPTYVEGDKVNLVCLRETPGKRIPKYITCKSQGWLSSTSYYRC